MMLIKLHSQYNLNTKRSHSSGVLNHLHIFLSKLVRVQLEQPLRYLRQRGKFGLFVDVLLSIFILKKSLKNMK